jgi:hypothetical protein
MKKILAFLRLVEVLFLFILGLTIGIKIFIGCCLITGLVVWAVAQITE